jgi:hypothetical protein
MPGILSTPSRASKIEGDLSSPGMTVEQDREDPVARHASVAEWWTLVSLAARPPFSPWIRYSSHRDVRDQAVEP